MPAEQLQLGTDDPLLGQIRDELMPEEMRIDPFLNTRGHRVLFDDLANASGRVRAMPIRLKEIASRPALCWRSIYCASSPRKLVGKSTYAILLPFSLRNRSWQVSDRHP